MGLRTARRLGPDSFRVAGIASPGSPSDDRGREPEEDESGPANDEDPVGPGPAAFIKPDEWWRDEAYPQEDAQHLRPDASRVRARLKFPHPAVSHPAKDVASQGMNGGVTPDPACC